jgi:glycosyltransferase involved in cell wall biosynthesis
MHIVHFCGALKGGPLSAIAEWSRRQVADGHRVSLIYSPLRDSVEEFRGDLSPQIELIPLEVKREIHLFGDFQACRAFTVLLRKLRPDIIHLHSSKAGAIGRLAAFLTGVPAVYSTHGIAYLRTDVSSATRALFFSLEWLLGLLGAKTVACSPSELHTMRFIPGYKCSIPNGIDLREFSLPAHEQTSDHLEIVLCGRITVQKNPALASAIAEESPPDWRWTWLGDGEQRELVERSGRIEVTGWQPRATTLARLAKGDILIHTSSWEGMPIAILESMALGLPVVATDVVGNRDLVVDGETGFLAYDRASFSIALETLSKSRELRQRMGQAGRRRIEAEFDQAKLAQRWADLYRQILSA